MKVSFLEHDTITERIVTGVKGFKACLALVRTGFSIDFRCQQTRPTQDVCTKKLCVINSICDCRYPNLGFKLESECQEDN